MMQILTISMQSASLAGTAAAGAAPSAGAALLVNALPLIAIFFIFWMFIFRPQQQRMRKHQSMIAAVKKNDTVITAGGLVGKVSKVIDDTHVEIELAQGVKVKAVKSTLADIQPYGVTSAND